MGRMKSRMHVRAETLHFFSIWYVIILFFTVYSGYVLDCLPTGCEKWKNISEQIEFIRSIDIRPTIVINLKVRMNNI